MVSDRIWHGKWISAFGCPLEAAPIFRKEFSLDNLSADTHVHISGMGFYVLYLNGKRVSDQLLSPAFTAYDKTVLYDTYDVGEYLHSGLNTVEILLGNGWYREPFSNAWKFDQAAWRADLQLIFELESEGKILLASDPGWQWAPSQITFNSLRSGETYDATKEPEAWQNAHIAHGPGGQLIHRPIPPIRVCEEISPVRIIRADPARPIYDFGVNLSGNVEIVVSGEWGQKVTIQYSEHAWESGQMDFSRIAEHVYGPRFQMDEYILSGQEEERWHSELGYNGFRYAQISGSVKIISVKARCFHTDLADAGQIACDFEPLMQIHRAVRQSTLTNFHHMPTDCPHREKNGWTGDAHLSSEQALFNFDMKQAYQKWLDDIVDSQRPNGAIACIVPTNIWGYNWGTGATWDAALFEIPWQVYRYTGDAEFLRRYEAPMEKYIAFLEDMGDDDIFRDGLGDWCPPEEMKKIPDEVLVTAYAYAIFNLYGKTSRVLGHGEKAAYAQRRAEEIKQKFLKTYVGVIENTQTFLALLLYFDFAFDREATAQALIAEIARADYHMQCGIFGAKFLFNVLTETGHFDVAWKVAMIEGYPGYRDMIDRGSGTLWEHWRGISSQNHHMFSEIGAWFYKALAGIQIDEEKPGFAHVIFHPHMPAEIHHFSAWHETPYGKMEITWDDERVSLFLPDGCSATVCLKDKQEKVTGRRTFARSAFIDS